MKKLAFTLFTFAVFIFLLSLVGFFVREKPLQKEVFYVSVNVSDKIGFDLNDSALTFGNVIKGSSARRSIVFSNDYSFPVSVEVSVQGEIEEIISSDKVIFFEAGEVENIPFVVTPNENMPDGFYSGNVTLTIKQTNTLTLRYLRNNLLLLL